MYKCPIKGDVLLNEKQDTGNYDQNIRTYLQIYILVDTGMTKIRYDISIILKSMCYDKNNSTFN